MSELLFHPIALMLVATLVGIIAACAFTEKRGAKSDPWEK